MRAASPSTEICRVTGRIIYWLMLEVFPRWAALFIWYRWPNPKVKSWISPRSHKLLGIKLSLEHGMPIAPINRPRISLGPYLLMHNFFPIRECKILGFIESIVYGKIRFCWCVKILCGNEDGHNFEAEAKSRGGTAICTISIE